MSALSTLIPLMPSSISQAMLFLSASRTYKPLWPTSLLKGSLALLFCAVELHVLGKGHPWLKLDTVGGRGGRWYSYTTLAVFRYSAEVAA